jgi:hypothetical protein
MMKTNKPNPFLGRYYWFFVVLFVSANAGYALQRFKRGAHGWELVNIPFILILIMVIGIVLVFIKRSLRKAILLSETVLAEPKHLRPPESGDPWTFFGSFTKQEIDKASSLLGSHGISHEIKVDGNFQIAPDGWSGPHCLWVHDKQVNAAKKLLMPIFQKG